MDVSNVRRLTIKLDEPEAKLLKEIMARDIDVPELMEKYGFEYRRVQEFMTGLHHGLRDQLK